MFGFLRRFELPRLRGQFEIDDINPSGSQLAKGLFAT